MGKNTATSVMVVEITAKKISWLPRYQPLSGLFTLRPRLGRKTYNGYLGTPYCVPAKMQDFLTGETLPDTDDERGSSATGPLAGGAVGLRQTGTGAPADHYFDFGNRVVSTIELCARIEGRRLFILRYGPGSLVTREKAAIAAARILDPDYRIPLAIVTNGRDAELLETAHGKVLATGMDCIPDRQQAKALLHSAT